MLLEAYLETKRLPDLSKRMNGPHHPDTLRLQRAAELQKSAGNSQEELLKMIGEPAILSGEVVTYKGRILHEDGCECIVSLPGQICGSLERVRTSTSTSHERRMRLLARPSSRLWFTRG